MCRSILSCRFVYYNLAIQRIMSVVILSDNNLNEIFIVTLVSYEKKDFSLILF